jgi:hypothetical protein
MGLMESPMDRGRLVVTPSPVLLDGQRNVTADLRPGESLYAFLQRHVDLSEQWEVTIGGRVVPVEIWLHVFPKHGQVIECRAAVGKSVLALVATIALIYFTFGIGAGAAGSLFIGSGAAIGGGYLAATAVYVAGSILINKALGPKAPNLTGQGGPDPTYSLNAARNTFRPYEPVPLLFGTCKITPDLATDQPYTFFRGGDQYLALTLNCGVNVDRVDALYNGDALLSDFEGVEDYYSGFSGMTEEDIPLYSNTDTVAGGTLDSPAGTYIQRTSADDSIRHEVDLEYNIYDFSSDGDPRWNDEGITVQYRAVGDATWLAFGSTTISGDRPKIQRKTLTKDVAQGQYEVQVKRNGTDTSGTGAHCEATWTSLRAVQADTGNYKGLSLIGVVCKATGQLSGALDELRAVAYSADLEYWDGDSWETDDTAISNPGAQILKYARGWYDIDGVLIAGMGLDDAQIDLDAIKAFILHCDANSYTYDYYLKEARSHDAVLAAIALAGFGQVTWAGGKLSVVWAADEQPLTGVVNMATIKRGQFQVDYTLAGGADGIEFTYLDATDWTNKTLRVSAPDVTTPLNPARVAGEGITSETHAAEMARYHLAQSLYQYKSIQYGADLEHLSYRRLSVLALQHDLTQWGYGGRVQAAVDDAGTITLTLDEPVPAGGTPYIGLRVPGEDVYRVFAVVAPAEETREIVLDEAWPADAALPGDASDNPADDTIWIYDFKTSPGYRVRVVDVQPESDLKGATVSVVPEDDAFWTYVKTGDYTPPQTSTLPSARPVASNVQASEATVVQGDTTFSEIHVTFDVTGRMDHALILVQYTDSDDNTDGELHKLAETRTRDASFRASGAGTYDIVVRPYSVDGIAGGAATLSFDSSLATIPVPDNFAVTVDSGAVRRYTWSYDGDTIAPPDLAGLEVRYITGHVAASIPSWTSMTPLGGIHEAGAFESLDPAAGDWTFAYRAITTAGLESGWLYEEATLTDSLPEVVAGVEVDTATALLDAQDALDAADDALGSADAAIANASAMIGAPTWSSSTTYALNAYASRNGVIYKSKAGSNLNHQPPNATWWTVTATVIAAADTLSASVATNAGAITSLSATVDSQGDDITANAAAIAAAEASITDIEGDVAANAGAISTLQSTVSSQGDDITSLSASLTAVQSDITDIEGDVSANAGAITSLTATVTSNGDDISANTTAITAIEATVNDPDTGVDATATAVELLQVDVTANADGIDTLNAKWSVTLNVDGYISGIESVNDGAPAGFTIIADEFKIVRPGGVGTYLYWETDPAITGGSGVIGMYAGTSRLYLGAGFGVSGAMVFHYGTAGDVINKTLDNAIFGIDSAGKIKMAGANTNYASGWSSGGGITSSYSSASPAVVTFNVASGTFKASGISISYSSSSTTRSQTRDTTVTYFLYYDDGALSGGAKTLQVSTSSSGTFDDPDHVVIGTVTVTVPAAATGGSGGIGGGSDGCVSVDAWVIRNGARAKAGEVVVGDVLSLFDPFLGASEGVVTYSTPVLADRLRIVTQSGAALTCSTTAPIPTERAGCVLAPNLMGHRVLVRREGVTQWEVVSDLVRLSRGWVQHITVGDRCFWAGDADADLLHHNLKPSQ